MGRMDYAAETEEHASMDVGSRTVKPSTVIPAAVAVLVIGLGTTVGVLLSSLDARLTANERLLEELEGQYAHLEGQLDAVAVSAQTAAVLEAEQEGLAARLSDLEDALGATDGRLEGLAADVEALDVAVGSFQRDVLSALGDDPERIPERLDTLATEAEALSDLTQGLAERLSELERRLGISPSG